MFSFCVLKSVSYNLLNIKIRTYTNIILLFIAGDHKYWGETSGYTNKMGGKISRAHRRFPPAVRARRAAIIDMERIQGTAHAGAQPAALPAAQRERRRRLFQ